MKHLHRLTLTRTALALISLTALHARATSHDHQHQHSSSFQQREQQVMPFDLASTIHTFVPTATGGAQRVTARRLTDAKNAALIRSHLRQEARRFAQGNFASPAYIHGADMPGLSVLAKAVKAGTLQVRYANVAGGAELLFVTKKPDVVKAVHAWFKAQVSDHGGHARMLAPSGKK